MAVNVFFPLSAEVWSMDCYCHWDSCNSQPPCGPAGCVHTKVNAQDADGNRVDAYPVDVGDPDLTGAPVRFYASKDIITSIRTEQYLKVCLVDPAPWTNGVIVHMFDAWGVEVGRVLYGHLSNPIPNNTYPNPWGKVVGYVPPLCPTCVSCYSGTHVHTQCSPNGARGSYQCHHRPIAGGSVLYSFPYY